MAASNQRVISREITPLENFTEPQTNLKYSLSLNESVTSKCHNEAYSPNASSELNTSIDYSQINHDGYNSDDSTYSYSRWLSNSKSTSISFSYEQSQIRQFYMDQEAAKHSQQYRLYPTVSRRFNLPPKSPSDDEKDGNDEIDDQMMDKILIECMCRTHKAREYTILNNISIYVMQVKGKIYQNTICDDY